MKQGMYEKVDNSSFSGGFSNYRFIKFTICFSHACGGISDASYICIRVDANFESRQLVKMSVVLVTCVN